MDTPINNNEKTLLLAAQAGDTNAFQTLLEGSLPKLRTLLVNHYKLNKADLDDIVQIASIKAWNKMATFRGDSAFVTWFFIILRNEAANFLQKQNHIFKHELSAHVIEDEGDYGNILHASLDDQLNETAQTILDKQETLKIYRQIINEALEKLTPSHSQIIKMVLEENKSYKEIAEMLNIPVGTVMSRLFFARKKAQKLIAQYAKRNELQLDCLGRCEQHTVS